jgi:flagellar hook assembly protein FlgD
MTFPRVLIAALAAAALLAPGASAGVRLVVRDQPVDHGVGAARKAPLRFNMVGLHWQGSGTVSFRTGSVAGAWSAWQPARPEAEDAPDRGSAEARRGQGWKLGNPYWTGPADAIQYRLDGDVRHLRAFFIWSPLTVSSAPAVARAAQPGILTRAQWGADESIVRGSPYYAERVRFAVVHHTAGTNSYSATQSAAIVRGIQRYHVLANGWNDIGYNFLVDKFGQVFEGRGGGIDRNVVGAHAQGFNTGSTGVAVLGTYSSSRVSKAARSALVRLLAWRLDVAHVDPLSRLTWISGGNPKYPAGTAVRLRAISGHRDTGPTSCPGSGLYGQLGGIASAVAARGLPKLFDPEVSGGLGGPVRVTGRLSSELPWTVTIRDENGAIVTSGSGSGLRVDWTWDASAVPFGSFTYTIEAGPDVRPWTARVPGPPPLAVQSLRNAPRVVARDRDGVVQPARISFGLTTAATVNVEVLNSSGSRIRRVLASASRPAGRSHVFWNGRNSAGDLVPSGHYTVRVSATSPGQSASAQRGVVADWTIAWFRRAENPFSPNRDGRRDTVEATFELTRTADVRLRVFRGTTRIATLVSSSLPAGDHAYVWNGRDRDGNRVPDGTYSIRLEATTALGTRGRKRSAKVDVTRPTVRIVSAVAGRRTRLVVRVSEPVRLVIRYGSSDPVTEMLPAGESVLIRSGGVRRVRVVGWDAAENRSDAVLARVRRV